MHIFLEKLLDIVFPQPQTVAHIEEMTAEQFASAAVRYEGLLPEHHAALDYRSDLVGAAIREVKYKGNRKIARLLAAAAHPALLHEVSELAIFEGFQNPLVIPVPISEKRRKERGFNQCELICDELAKQTGADFEFTYTLLRKSHETPHQSETRSRAERIKNLRGSFSVAEKKLIRKRNIVVIDDVVTTGSTLNEISATLRRAGAAKVLCFAISH